MFKISNNISNICTIITNIINISNFITNSNIITNIINIILLSPVTLKILILKIVLSPLF